MVLLAESAVLTYSCYSMILRDLRGVSAAAAAQTRVRWQVSDQRGLTRPVASWLRRVPVPACLFRDLTNRTFGVRRLQTRFGFVFKRTAALKK